MPEIQESTNATEILFTNMDETENHSPVCRMSVFGAMMPPLIRFLENFDGL
jgi:hypothetical protein